MKKTSAGLLLLLILAMMPTYGVELHVRLVAARAQGAVDPQLRDVARLLEQLPFKGFELLRSRQLPLPAKGSIGLDNGLVILLDGSLDNLTVLGQHGDKRLLKTTVSLKLDRPFITVLPVTMDNRKVLLILIARQAG